MIQIYWNLIRYNGTLSFDQRADIYLENLIDENLLPQTFAKDNQTKKRITEILFRFDYEVFQYDLDDQNGFLLKSEELHALLSAGNETLYEQILTNFIRKKIFWHRAKLKKLEVQEERNKINQERYSNRLKRSGIIDEKDGSLIYGLWHNTLFTKINRSSLSHLYDRRLLNASLVPDNPKIWIDLNFLSSDCIKRNVAFEIRSILSVNKYHSITPFTIEFVCPKNFENINKVLTWLDDPSQYQYVIHRANESVDLLDENQRLIYLNPGASKTIKLSDLCNRNNIIVIPMHHSKSIRDPKFTLINRLESERIKVKRLPTFENVIWNSYHGVLPWSLSIAILNDFRFQIGADWRSVLKQHLLPKKIIQNAEEIVEKNLAAEISQKERRAIVERFRNSQSKIFDKK